MQIEANKKLGEETFEIGKKKRAKKRDFLLANSACLIFDSLYSSDGFPKTIGMLARSVKNNPFLSESGDSLDSRMRHKMRKSRDHIPSNSSRNLMQAPNLYRHKCICFSAPPAVIQHSIKSLSFSSISSARVAFH